jgi:hypothetical protein
VRFGFCNLNVLKGKVEDAGIAEAVPTIVSEAVDPDDAVAVESATTPAGIVADDAIVAEAIAPGATAARGEIDGLPVERTGPPLILNGG